MKWNHELEPDEKEKIILNYSDIKLGKRRLKKIAKKIEVYQKKEQDLTYWILKIPVAGESFQTDGTIPEVEALEDDDIPNCFRFVIRIDNEDDECIAEATGFEFSLPAFLTTPESIMNPLDTESYSDVAAGMIMFNKLFPRTAPTGGAHDPLEKKIEQELVTMNPAMIWPEIFGNPYNEKRTNDIWSALVADDDLLFDNVLLITEMVLYPSRCNHAGREMVNAILSTEPRFLYMTCDVAVDGKYDGSMEREMVSLARENGMTIEGDDTKGYYGYLIDGGYIKIIEELDNKK